MERDISHVARKLETFFDYQEVKTEKKEPGILSNLACVALMAAAVFLTKISLILTRTAKKLGA